MCSLYKTGYRAHEDWVGLMGSDSQMISTYNVTTVCGNCFWLGPCLACRRRQYSLVLLPAALTPSRAWVSLETHLNNLEFLLLLMKIPTRVYYVYEVFVADAIPTNINCMVPFLGWYSSNNTIESVYPSTNTSAVLLTPQANRSLWRCMVMHVFPLCGTGFFVWHLHVKVFQAHIFIRKNALIRNTCIYVCWTLGECMWQIPGQIPTRIGLHRWTP